MLRRRRQGRWAPRAAWAGSFLDRFPNIKLELSVTDRRVDLIRVPHPFGRQLPLRARLFIDFLVEAIGDIAGR